MSLNTTKNKMSSWSKTQIISHRPSMTNINIARLINYLSQDVLLLDTSGLCSFCNFTNFKIVLFGALNKMGVSCCDL